MLIAPVGLGGALAVPALTAMLLDAVPSTNRALPAPYSTPPGQVGGAIAVAVFDALSANADPPVSGTLLGGYVVPFTVEDGVDDGIAPFTGLEDVLADDSFLDHPGGGQGLC